MRQLYERAECSSMLARTQATCHVRARVSDRTGLDEVGRETRRLQRLFRDTLAPLRGEVDVRAVQFGDRAAAKELERANQIGPKNLDRARDAGAARRSQAVRVRTPD